LAFYAPLLCYVAHILELINRSTENDILVRLGEYDFSKTSTTRKTFQVDKITRHEDYDRRGVKNDIALLKLKTSVTFSSVILPICLPEPNLLQLDGKPTYIAGNLLQKRVAGFQFIHILNEH
jgi:Trypsin